MSRDSMKNNLSLKSYQTLQEQIDARLVADVVHSIRNGLGGIGGFAALLDRDLDSQDPRKRFVQRIQNGVHRVNDVICQLMILSRPIKLKPESTQIYNLIATEINQQRNKTVSAKLIRFKGEAQKEMEMCIDPQILHQILTHTLQFISELNANIKFIECDKQDDTLSLSFQFTMNMYIEFPYDLTTLRQEDCSIDARLSISIVKRLMSLLEGDVTLQTLSKRTHQLYLH